VACLCADADDFSSFSGKNFLFVKLSCEKKMRLATPQGLFFVSSRKLTKQNVFA
jgi:hypothetical protein